MRTPPPTSRPAATRSESRLFSLSLIAAATLGATVPAQINGPIKPIAPPPGNQMPENANTAAKVLLGHLLFFEEQMSAPRTVACATCHMPEAGGTDPRPKVLHPGSPETTLDDALGSAGVIQNMANGQYVLSSVFGLSPQATRRKAPSVLTASVFETLFWDGKAKAKFIDPLTQTTPQGLGVRAALESQAIFPPVASVEMGHLTSDWPGVVTRLTAVAPLALAIEVPSRLTTFIANRTYPQIFDAVFADYAASPGLVGVTPTRVAMALAAYQRTLLPQQARVLTPGYPGPTEELRELQAQGGFLFERFPPNGAGCVGCHTDVDPGNNPPATAFGHNRKTDGLFHNIGLVPKELDPGLFEQTGLEADKGKFKTPSLFNVGLQNTFFHNGSASTLREVVDFYFKGGNVRGPTSGNELVNLEDFPLLDTEFNRRALVEYLKIFTDARLTESPLQPPFDRPILRSEAQPPNPLLYGEGTDPCPPGGTPAAIAIEPPHRLNNRFTLGVKNAFGGAPAWLLVGTQQDLEGTEQNGITYFVNLMSNPAPVLLPVGLLSGDGAGNGHTSATFTFHLPAVPDTKFYCQWIIGVPELPCTWSASEGIKITVF